MTHYAFSKTNGTFWGMGNNAQGELALGQTIGMTNQPVQMLAGVPIAGAFTGGTAIHTLIVAPPAPPVITLQTTNQSLASGQDAVFAVAAYGFAPLSYQWKFDGTEYCQRDLVQSFAAQSHRRRRGFLRGCHCQSWRQRD